LSIDGLAVNFPLIRSADDSLRLVLVLGELLIVESRLDHGNDLQQTNT
jgi:hypothetical protein